MDGLGVGTSSGCDPLAIRNSVNPYTISPASLPPSALNIKIEMVTPKVEMVYFSGNFDESAKHSGSLSQYLDQERPRKLTSEDGTVEKHNAVLGSRKLTYLVGQDRPMCTGCVKFFENENEFKKHLKYCGTPTRGIVKFKCFHCFYESKWKTGVRRHIETRHLLNEIERLTCSGCGKSYKGKDNLRVHMKYCEKSNNEIVKHKCPRCLYETKYRSSLKTHLKRVHSIHMPYPSKCSECGRSYENEDAFKRHLKYCGNSTSKIVKFKCYHCSHETKWKNCLRRHIRTLHLFEEERPTCHGCGKSLKNKDNLRVHMKYCEKFNNNIVKHECPICSYKTKRKGQLKTHIRRVHAVETAERPTCTGCGRSYKGRDSLVRHMKYCEKINSEIVKHKCPFCFSETKRKSDLKAHIKHVHSAQPSERLNCHGCGKSLKNQGTLRSHIKFCVKLNDEVVKHKCTTCLYETKWKSQLNAHIRRFHSIETPYLCLCTGCGISCDNEIALKCHMKYCGNKTNEIVTFKCFHCSHETKLKKNLRKHIEIRHIHEKIVRPTCPACGHSFKNKDNLKGHQKYCEQFNNVIVRHKCPICSTETKRKSDLNAHMVRIHSIGITERVTCAACGKSFKNKDRLESHRKKYCEKFNDIVIDNCVYENGWKGKLNSNFTRIHSIEQSCLCVCSDCGRSFDDKFALKCHMRYCGNKTNKIVQFICFHCSHETKWKNNLRKHIEMRHLEQETKRLTSVEWGKSYEKGHQKYCEKINNEIVKLKCQICFFETKRNSDLRVHMRHIHSVETRERVTCTACGKSLKNKNSLKSHRKYCEKLKVVVKYECPMCSYETKWKRNLKAHLRRIHSIETTDPPTSTEHRISCDNEDEHKSSKTQFKCYHCFYETKWKNCLRRHIETWHLVEEMGVKLDDKMC